MEQRVLLDQYPLHVVQMGAWDEVQDERQRPLPLRQLMLPGFVCLAAVGAVTVRALALLDTGTDITAISLRLVEVLEESAGGMIPVRRRIRSNGVMRPALDLAFVLPDDEATVCVSDYGFIACADHELDLGDIWIGQDLLNQWVMTLDGIAATLTIACAVPDEML